MHTYHGLIYGIVTALLNAVMAVFIKLLADVPVATIVFVRFAAGLPFILLLAYLRGNSIAMQEIPRHLFRGIAGFAAVYFYAYAVVTIPLVNAITLGNTAPLFMPLLVMIRMKKLVSKWRFIAAAIGFLGVVILLRPGGAIVEWGSGLALATGFTSAIALMEVRILSKHESSDKILLYYFFLSTVLGLFPMIISWQPIVGVKEWGYLIILGLASVIYQYCLTKSYTHAPATKASIFSYLSVVFGGFAGWLFFQEIPDMLVWIGTGLIICGALLAILDNTPPRSIKKMY